MGDLHACTRRRTFRFCPATSTHDLTHVVTGHSIPLWPLSFARDARARDAPTSCANATAASIRAIRARQASGSCDIRCAGQDGKEHCRTMPPRLQLDHSLTLPHTACCVQAIVQIPRYFRHPKVDKDTKRRSKIWAHDEFNLCSIGDNHVRNVTFRDVTMHHTSKVVRARTAGCLTYSTRTIYACLA